MWTLRSLQLGSWLTRVLPVPVGYAITTTVAILFWLINLRARRHVLENLSQVRPEFGRLARWRASVRVVATVFWNYYDLLRLQRRRPDELLSDLDVQGSEHLMRALEQGHGAIILSAHIGNFSVVAQYPALLGLRAAIIAERVEPPSLFTYMCRLRSKLGVEIIPPGRQAIPPILRLLRSNGVLLVAGDRDVLRQGLPVPFFGEDASLPTGPILLALRTGAALVPAFTVRTSIRHSRVEIMEPIPLQRSHDRDADLRVNLERMAAALEYMIRVDPSQWGVLQPVWGERPAVAIPRGEGIGPIPADVPALESPSPSPTGASERARVARSSPADQTE